MMRTTTNTSQKILRKKQLEDFEMNYIKTQTASPVHKQWGQMGSWAHVYDLIMVLMTFGKDKKLRDDTIKLARIKPGDSILEIGCGTGSLTIAAKEHVGPSGKVAGIDIAPEMVTVASRKATRKSVDVSFQVGSIEQIPFPENHFDVVLCSFMIFHMPEDVRRKGFPEIYRVLKSGGHVFILDGILPDKPKQPRSETMHDVRELAPVLKENFFTEIEMEETPLKLMGTRFWFLRGKAEKV